MADLLIRDIDPKLKRELEERARAHGRSLSEEAKSMLCDGTCRGKARKKGIGHAAVLDWSPESFVAMISFSKFRAHWRAARLRMIILDTNVVSDAFQPQAERTVRRWLDAQPPTDLFICAPVLAEMRFGIERLPAGRRGMSLSGW